MKKLVLILPVVLLAAACGTSGGGTATTTVTKTVTATVTVTAAAAAPAATDSATDSAAAPSSAAVAATPNACSLLTPSEAKKLARTKLMKPVGAGADAAGNFVMCQFTGPPSGPIAQVEVYVGDGAQQQLHIDRDNLKHTFKTVPGIGDQCLQEEGFIFVEKNGLWASIHLVRLGDFAQYDKPLQTAMRELTARLP